MYKYALAVLFGFSSFAFADSYCIVNSLDTGHSVYVTVLGPDGSTTNLMCGDAPSFPYCNSPTSSSSSSGSTASSDPFPPEDCTVQGASSSSSTSSSSSSTQSSTQSSASSP